MMLKRSTLEKHGVYHGKMEPHEIVEKLIYFGAVGASSFKDVETRCSNNF